MRELALAKLRPCPAGITPWIGISDGTEMNVRLGAMVLGNGAKSESPAGEALRRSYEKGITDEFIEPITIVDPRNEPVGLIRDYDSVW